MARTLVRCGRLFDGVSTEIRRNQTLVIEGGNFTSVAATPEIPAAPDDVVIDHSNEFAMPGLIDVHTHLSYGNARTEEDIDIYASMEFRTLRGMYFAPQVLAAGYTSICAPGGAGMLSSAIRDAIDADLFEGPSVTAAGPYITSRQGLTDWYPTWIGVPSTSIGRLVKSSDEAIEEVRRQVKDGVDAVKIALDGIIRRPDGEHVAAFTQEETSRMVAEIKRLGKISIAHCRGREATLYAARAGMDLIFHGSYMDDEALDAVVKNGCAVSPSLTFLRNTMDFAGENRKAKKDAYQAEYDSAVEALTKARKAGVRMPTGTDTGFAVTPFGEWHARELEIYVEDLGFDPIEALRAATSVSATVLRPADKVGRIAAGYRADLLALKEDPTRNVSILLDRSKFANIIREGKPIGIPRRGYEPKKVTDFAMSMFDELYTRERVAAMRVAQSP